MHRDRVQAPQPEQPAVPYVGPAFDQAHLSPALGLVCDPEVMPPEVGRIIDSLHRNFHEQFAGVE